MVLLGLLGMRLIIWFSQTSGRERPPVADYPGLGPSARTIRHWLDRSINGLHDRMPEMSAQQTLSIRQKRLLVVLAIVLVLGLVLQPLAFGIALCALATGIYVFVLGYRADVFVRSLRQSPQVDISDDEARSIPDDQLPVYTVLVAAYHEHDVIGNTIAAINRLEYPRTKLDVKLLLEEDDNATIGAARAAAPGRHIEIVPVPVALPRTKPKALNYGLNMARGELVTVFDAEDQPDRLQLRKAAAAFWRLPSNVACLQANLSYYNSQQNMVTRWFTSEYHTWFRLVLPILVARGVPVPLGGTSMHMKTSILVEVGAWDPHNVTEDADLGIRLHRLGYRTEVLNSNTFEEANSDIINWVKQRSRWYKGYIQTWLVHMRNPLKLYRELGARGFFSFNVIVGGTPTVAFINPLFWFLAILWFLAKFEFIQALFPGWVYYPAMLCLIFGNFMVLYQALVGLQLAKRPDLLRSVLLLPVYWALMAIAALRAFLQLVSAPSFWEKTMHGLVPERAGAGGDEHGAG
jgi:cellulose synthase/poly-beta-1,6-N-acetylglucosamine synthase-like glycosyltransferase